MLDCVDQLSTLAAAAAAMCSGLDVTDTTHERSGSTTAIIMVMRNKLLKHSNTNVNKVSPCYERRQRGNPNCSFLLHFKYRSLKLQTYLYFFISQEIREK